LSVPGRTGHVTDTITPHDIPLSDAHGSLYTLSGSSWFGDTTNDPSGESLIIETNTEHFVIRNAGGVYAKVQVIDHQSQNGKTATFDRGTCERPQD
jgi:hypothetical protein